jgi:hypothetical protein
MGSHDVNEHSSRSHSILTIYLEIQGFDEEKNPQHRYGKINFVDLAGSEKVKESKTTLDTFAEALSINKSLLTLGKCITALSDPKKRSGHIPFRDSKLTKILADSLSGRGLTLMIACISPAFQNLNETLKTVRYAMQARRIQTRAIIQLDPQEEMVYNFKLEIAQIRKENSRLKDLLRNDPKYQDALKDIAEATEEMHKKLLRSRPASPVHLKAKAISYRDRFESSIPSLPDIKARSRSTKPSKSRTPLTSHSRRSTINAPFSSVSTPSRKSLTNALPTRLTASPKKAPPKSAAKQRIDEMKKSTAPAGQQSSEKNDTRRNSLKKVDSRNFQETAESPRKTKKKLTIKESDEKVGIGPKRSSNTPHPTKKIM